jgi:hypothetical protein
VPTPPLQVAAPIRDPAQPPLGHVRSLAVAVMLLASPGITIWNASNSFFAALIAAVPPGNA